MCSPDGRNIPPSCSDCRCDGPSCIFLSVDVSGASSAGWDVDGDARAGTVPLAPFDDKAREETGLRCSNSTVEGVSTILIGTRRLRGRAGALVFLNPYTFLAQPNALASQYILLRRHLTMDCQSCLTSEGCL